MRPLAWRSRAGLCVRPAATRNVGALVLTRAVLAVLVACALFAARAGAAGGGDAERSGNAAPVVGQAGDASAARLAAALDAYAEAMAESSRDERIALFARAEAGFAALIEAGHESAALYTNLGNAALQAEHPGRAVLAYDRALALDPESATARQNLAHVRSLLPAWVPRPDDAAGLDPLRLHRRLPPRLRAELAAGCFVFAAGCLVLAVRRREGAWRGLALAGGLAWGLLLGSVLLEGGSDRAASTRAVVMLDEVPARSADSSLSPLALPDPLPAGVEVELLEERGEWVRARLANGRDVWLRASSVERVHPG